MSAKQFSEYSLPKQDASSPSEYTPPPATPRRLDFLASPIFQTILADLCLSVCAYSIYCLLLTFDTFNALLDEELEWLCAKVWSTPVSATEEGIGSLTSFGMKYFAVEGQTMDEGKLVAICGHQGWKTISTFGADQLSDSPLANHWIVLALLISKTLLAYYILTRSAGSVTPASSKPLDYLLGSIASHAFLSLFLFASRIDYTPLATIGLERKEFVVGLAFWVVVVACALVGIESLCKGLNVSCSYVKDVRIDEKGALVEKDGVEKVDEVSFWNKVDLVQIVVRV